MSDGLTLCTVIGNRVVKMALKNFIYDEFGGKKHLQVAAPDDHKHPLFMGVDRFPTIESENRSMGRILHKEPSYVDVHLLRFGLVINMAFIPETWLSDKRRDLLESIFSCKPDSKIIVNEEN